MKIYLVGGAVRDTLLNQLLGYSDLQKDRDWVVVGAKPEELLQQGYIPVGKDFPVFLHPVTHEEYALARKERKIRPGYHGFECQFDSSVTLEEDLMRRDLTINAMAMVDGELVDPFHGLADLKNRVLRHVSPAFSEDPVRILRVARFAARFATLGFQVAEETITLMQQMVANGEVDTLVPERVWKEWEKALGESAPWVFFDILWQVNALSRLKIFQSIGMHWKHNKQVSSTTQQMFPRLVAATNATLSLEDKLNVRFAALCLDLSYQASDTIQLIEELCCHYRIPNHYRSLALLVVKCHMLCHQIMQYQSYELPQRILELLKKLDAFRRTARFFQFLAVCELDHQISGDIEYLPKELLQRAYQVTNNIALSSLPQQAQTLKGIALGEAIDRYRIAQISQVLQDICNKD